MPKDKPRAYHLQSQKELYQTYTNLMYQVQIVVNCMSGTRRYPHFERSELSSKLKAIGFDEAFIGYGGQACGNKVLIYDAEKCIEILKKRDGMDMEGAIEFFEYNVEQAYVGQDTPIFIWPMSIDEIEELEV